MKRFLVAAAFVLLASLPACQCDERPDVGEVADDDETSAVVLLAPRVA